MTENQLRQLPPVDKLLNTDEAKAFAELYSRDLVVEATRAVSEELRQGLIRKGEEVFPEEALKAAEKAVELADEQMKVRYKSRVDQIKKEMSEKKEKDKLKEKEQK